MKLFGYDINKVTSQKATNQNNYTDLKNKLSMALSNLGFGATFFTESSENYIKRAYEYNHLVFSVINRKNTMAASIPWVLYKVIDKKAAKLYQNTSMQTKAENPMAAMKLKAKAFEETVHPVLSRILERPNETQGWHEWFLGLGSYKDITGNAYVYGLSPDTGKDAGKPVYLFNLPAQKMQIVGGDYMHPIESYKMILNYEVEFKPSEVCHIKNFNPNFDTAGSWLYGMSPLKAGSRAVQASNDNITARAKMYQNIGAMGILSNESENEELVLTPEQAINVKDKYKQLYAGSEAINDIIVTAGKWKWQNFGLSPVDLALLDAMEADLRDVCNIYRFPSQLMNDANSTKFNTYGEAKKSAYTDSVLPDIDHIKDGLNNWLCKAWSDASNTYYIEPDLMQILELQDNFNTQVTALTGAEWLTTNEKRMFQNYEPLNLPNMDVPLVSAGKTPITDLSLSNDIGL